MNRNDGKWWLTASDQDIQEWFQNDQKDRVAENMSGYWPEMPQRIIACGDIHGDFRVCLQVLYRAGLIESPENPNWTGGNTWFVQCGDILDRRARNSKEPLATNQPANRDEGNELRIMGLLAVLADQARAQGGNVLAVLGNHEWWNIGLFDFSYTTPKSRNTFLRKENNRMAGLERRKEAFLPGSWLARWIGRNRYWMVQIGSWIFVHGSFFGHPENIHSMVRRQQILVDVTGKVADQTRINFEIALRSYLFGEPVNRARKELLSRLFTFITENRTYGFSREEHLQSQMQILQHYRQSVEHTELSKTDLQELTNRENAYRPIRCTRLSQSLQYFNANFLVVAHTPHREIQSDCDGHLWRIDLAMSEAFSRAMPEPRFLGYLEITPSGVQPQQFTQQNIQPQLTPQPAMSLKRGRNNNQNNRNQQPASSISRLVG